MNIKSYCLEDLGQKYGLKLQDQALPQPGPGEVRVRLKAASLNYRDLLMLEKDASENLSGLIPVSDGVGQVEALGEGSKRFQIGARVAGSFFHNWISGPYQQEYRASSLGGGRNGMLSEAVVLSEQALADIPDYLTDPEAACVPCAAVTAWNGLIGTGVLQIGANVLIQGTGGVSIFGLQIAKAQRARVLITSSSNAKLQRAKALGADELINYRETPNWEEEVLKRTSGRGVDHILEVVGGANLRKSLTCLAGNGQIALIGVLQGFEAEIDAIQLMYKNARLYGIYVGSRTDLEATFAALERFKIRPIIDRTFSFEEAPQAYEYLKSAQHFGKIVINFKN